MYCFLTRLKLVWLALTLSASEGMWGEPRLKYDIKLFQLLINA